MSPRSSATTLSPASASSFARMPPVQPRPTMTTSTSLSFVAMCRPPSAHVRNADRFIGERLVLEFLDVLAMHRDRAREADQPPAGLISIAAMDRVGEHTLHHGLVHHGPELACRQSAIEGDAAARKCDQHVLTLRFGELVEAFVIVGFAAVRVGGGDAGAIELCWRQRQLIALARLALLPGALHVEAVALAPGAREGTVDIDVDADVGALRAELVSRHHVVDQRLDEGDFLEIEELVGGGWRCGGGWLLRLRLLWHDGWRCSGGGGAAHYGAFQKVAPAESLLRHGVLPLPGNAGFKLVLGCPFRSIAARGVRLWRVSAAASSCARGKNSVRPAKPLVGWVEP